MNWIDIFALEGTISHMNDLREYPHIRLEDEDMKGLPFLGTIKSPVSACWHLYKAVTAFTKGNMNESKSELYKSAAFVVCTAAFPIFGCLAPTKTILALDRYRVVEYNPPAWLEQEYHAHGSVDPIVNKIVDEIQWVIDYGIDRETFIRCYQGYVEEILNSANVAMNTKVTLHAALGRIHVTVPNTMFKGG